MNDDEVLSPQNFQLKKNLQQNGERVLWRDFTKHFFFKPLNNIK
jgi:hypothetical protein